MNWEASQLSGLSEVSPWTDSACLLDDRKLMADLMGKASVYRCSPSIYVGHGPSIFWGASRVHHEGLGTKESIAPLRVSGYPPCYLGASRYEIAITAVHLIGLWFTNSMPSGARLPHWRHKSWITFWWNRIVTAVTSSSLCQSPLAKGSKGQDSSPKEFFRNTLLVEEFVYMCFFFLFAQSPMSCWYLCFCSLSVWMFAHSF